ncbi:MAG: three-Cys-motif partner protein TcmP [Planctomycetota bacterium]|jgi:three-Cys-motif partner protein
MSNIKLDEIGYWSEIKLDIVQKYATAYSTIINKKPTIQQHLYIDGFAGAGVHISRKTKGYIPGSPLNALNVEPPFSEYHFIDLDGKRAQALRNSTADNPKAFVYEGDCNTILLQKIFPRASYSDYKRALCLLDPYGLHLNWEVIRTAGQMKSVEIFLNFPVMDMNMNVLWRNPDKVRPTQITRMNSFWGDQSWRDAAYTKTKGLFDDLEEKVSNKAVAEEFRTRLNKVAGFSYVPKPLPMRNTTGSIIYYLFFASPNKIGAKIVKDIFNKYRDKGIT